MAIQRLPGKRSNVQLLVTSVFTIISLFIMIIGHLAIVFYGYGIATGSETFKELAKFLPGLEEMHLFIIAGLAVAFDIWIVISQKKARDKKIKR